MDYLVTFASLAQQYSDNPLAKFAVDEIFDIVGRKFINLFANAKEKKRTQAFKNTLDFAERIRDSLGRAIAKGEATADRLEQATSSISVEIFIGDATERAAETDSRLTHEYLARLVSKRLTTEDDSLLAIKLRLALDLLSSVTQRQLRTLGLLYLYRVYPGEWEGLDTLTDLDAAEADFKQWIERNYAPFADLDGEWLDLSHLQGLTLVRISEAATGGVITHSPGASPIVGKASQLLGYDRLSKIVDLMKMERLWSRSIKLGGNIGLQWVELQPTGNFLGALVFDSLTGNESDFSWLDGQKAAAEKLPA